MHYQLKKIKNKSTRKTHGLSRHPLYNVWDKMIRRCYDKEDNRYSTYGGRGVKVCNEWLTNFKSFYDWAILNGWEHGLRIDKDIKAFKAGVPSLLYSPEFCSIVTLKSNMNYMSTNRVFFIDGERFTLTQLSEKYNIHWAVLRARIEHGWGLQLALTVPVRKCNY